MKIKEILGNLLADKKRAIVAITCLIIAASSVPFERIQDDEVIYFLESRHILTTGPFAHASLIFVPEILGAIALSIYNNLLTIRLVSALAVLATSVLIYNIKKDDSSFISAMLFLTSFYTIRFGFRYYLDPYAGLFTIAAIYFLYKQQSHFVGVYSMLAVFSRATASPLFPIFAILVYFKRIGFKKFVAGSALVAVLGLVWIYLSSSTMQTAVSTNVSQFVAFSYGAADSPYLVLKGWLQYVLISPLIFFGVVYARGGRNRIEFYPMIFALIVMSLAPGFLLDGGATEYPYIFNTIACVTAGFGLQSAYKRFHPSGKSVVKVLVAVLIVLFAGQFYLATALSVNHIEGVQDYGYWNDQQLLTYMNEHYTGGKIYSSTMDVFLDQRLATNSTWIPQTVTPALVDNPPWLITFTSYIIVGTIPANATIATIGPYTIIHSGQNLLSSFIQSSNTAQFFQ